MQFKSDTKHSRLQHYPLSLKYAPLTLIPLIRFTQRYSHPFVSVRVVELHVVTRLYPADGPCLLPGYWRHKDPGTGSEVRRPVAQDHAGRLVDAGGVGVDGAVHLQDGDAVSETLGLTPDALDAAHRIE